tara:strand:+ start:1249 stop:1695 length:447 start_codon:yes stop_codon:yes gene_type:complete
MSSVSDTPIQDEKVTARDLQGRGKDILIEGFPQMPQEVQNMILRNAGANLLRQRGVTTVELGAKVPHSEFHKLGQIKPGWVPPQFLHHFEIAVAEDLDNNALSTFLFKCGNSRIDVIKVPIPMLMEAMTAPEGGNDKRDGVDLKTIRQ